MTRAQIDEKADRAWRLWLWAFERSDRVQMHAAMAEQAMCVAMRRAVAPWEGEAA